MAAAQTENESGAQDNTTERKKRAAFRENVKKAFAAFKQFVKTKKGKKVIVSVVLAVAVLAAATAGFTVADHQKTAYLEPYQEKYPGVSFPEGIKEEFCEIYAENPNVAGRIRIADCGYESYAVKGSSSKLPYLDRSNSTDELDFNTVLYMPEAACDLEAAYSTADAYLKSGQKVTYSTLFEDYEFNVVGAFYTNRYSLDDDDYVFPYNVTQQMTPLSFGDYTDRLYHRFLYDTGYRFDYDEDKLLTISVPSDFMPHFEFVVVCALGAEKRETAQVNDSVHYPQVWYDEHNMQNPYRFASKWYPIIYTDDTREVTSRQSKRDY